MDVKKTGVSLLILCFATLLISAQVIFNPDPEEDVQLQPYLLTPPVNVTTVRCYSSSPIFKLQYVSVNDNAVRYNIDTGGSDGSKGIPVIGSVCSQNRYQYRIKLENLHFIGDPALVGGAFKLKATLDNKEENSSISRRIYIFPVPVTTVTISPGSRSTLDVYEKQSVTFLCTTNDASPPLKILWFLGSSDVTSQAGSNKTTLTLHVTILYHQMSVKCVAWNSGNTANPSDSTTLNVKSSAKFVTDQRYQVIHLNRTASVGITFYCNPPATMSGVEWINKTDLNDQAVGSSEFVSLSIVEDNVKLVIGNNNLTLRGQRAFLNFTSVESYHSGYYVLKIENGVSLISGRGIMLDVSAAPNPPANLTVQCREGVAQLSWSYTDIYNSELSFHLLYKEEDEDTYKVLEKEFTNGGRGQLLYANVMNIKPKTVYQFKIASKNDKGLSEYTDTKTCAIFDNKIDTSSTGPSVGGVAGGLTAVFLVLIVVLIGVIIMRERRYRLEKGKASKGSKTLTMKYEDVLSSTNSNEQVSEEHSQDERSTYEEVQNSRDDHTYEHV